MLYFDIYEDIVISLSKYLRMKKGLRNILFPVSFIILMIDIFVFFVFEERYNTALTIFSVTSALILVTIFIASTMAFLDVEQIKKDPLKAELERLSEEREELQKKVEKNDVEPVESVFNRVQLNLNQTTEYYTINKSQAKKSFNLSMTAIIFGFITIIIGIWMVYLGQNLSLSVVSIASGILLEFIGAMYFVVYNKSLKQFNFFYSKLEKVQDIMIAIELTNSISDESKQLELKEKIVINLLERSTNN